LAEVLFRREKLEEIKATRRLLYPGQIIATIIAVPAEAADARAGSLSSDWGYNIYKTHTF
jgi:hypothetical protein